MVDQHLVDLRRADIFKAVPLVLGIFFLFVERRIVQCQQSLSRFWEIAVYNQMNPDEHIGTNIDIELRISGWESIPMNFFPCNILCLNHAVDGITDSNTGEFQLAKCSSSCLAHSFAVIINANSKGRQNEQIIQFLVKLIQLKIIWAEYFGIWGYEANAFGSLAINESCM